MKTIGAADFGDGEGRSEISKLLEAARTGGADALNRLLSVAYLYCRLRAVDDIPRAMTSRFSASDIAQNSAVDVVQGFERFQGRSQAFFAWLRTIVQHNTIDLQRKHRRVTGEEGPLAIDLHNIPEPVRADPLDTKELKARVDAAMGQLSEDQRRVLQLRIWDRLRWDDIGIRMNRSGDAARQCFARALDKVRDDLGGEDQRPAR
jgi:RNA polymerase sigma-70 factor (ECF subfamily)